jgi:hypothetical protein
MTRCEIFDETVNLGSPLILARSAVGGCSIASTSPDNSAATRAGSFLMILNVTFSHGDLSPQ